MFLGQKIIRLTQVDSTNNYAAQLLRQSPVFEGTVVVAEFQEKGRGQRGNCWESEPGANLTFSIILNPVFIKAEQQFVLNKIISLAICDYLKSAEIAGVSVKWPNDVLVNGKKIAGILIENIIRSNQITHTIAGIGFNVNQTNFHQAENPASLKIITGKNFSVELCLERICGFIEARYLKLKTNIQHADDEYLQSLYRINEWANYSLRKNICTARITGVSQYGLLMLEKETGESVNCDFKEIKFL